MFLDGVAVANDFRALHKAEFDLLTQTDIPNLPRLIRRAGLGAVTIPLTQPHSHVGT